MAKISGKRYSRTNIIAGYSKFFKKLFSPKTSKGFTKTDTFFDWLKDDLLPEIQIFSLKNKIRNLVLVLDNASFHKAKKIQELVESYGFKLLFLSPYSPDLNPIEHQWWVLKHNLAKMRTEAENFWDDLKYTLWSMSCPQV